MMSQEAGKLEHKPAPEDVRQGAWQIGEGVVRFALWAPGKARVAVIGSFNDWSSEAAPMAVGENGLWWCELELAEGTHRYLFAIDGDMTIGDPYAKEVDWTAEGPHALIRVGEAPFEWTDEGYEMPPPESWVIYEAHVGDFSPEGTFAGMTGRLDYLKDLGINALELMPIFEFPGDRSWGYNPVYTMAPEKTYGSLEDFKTLVNEAHARGIAIILDMVFNHVGHEHPFTQLYAKGENPYFGDDDNPWGFPDLNHWDDATKGYVYQVQNYWLNDCHIDAFRYDASAYIGYDGENGMSFIAHNARELKPHAFLIYEQIPEAPDLVSDTELNAAWHETWHHAVLAQLTETDYQGFAYGDMEALKAALAPTAKGYGSGRNIINYTESHDQQRVIFEVQQGPAAGGALSKSVLGAAFLLTAPGIPMLLFGQEIATNVEKEASMEAGNRPNWDEALQDDGVKWLFETYQRLIWLRREAAVLWSDGVEVWHADPESKVLVYRRFVEGEDAELLCLLNFSGGEQTFKLSLPRGGKYFEVLTQEDWTLTDGEAEFSLEGSAARILKRVAAA